MGNLSNPLSTAAAAAATSTFKPILIHAASREENCTRDILVSSSMTLYQLHQLLSIAFGLDESNIEHHSFTLAATTTDLDIETSYEIIGAATEQSLDGFITQIAPGVYIEHTHPHEPLPLFSIYNNESEEAKMAFRLLRDERCCTLDSLTRNEICYEFNSSTKNFCIKLNLQAVNLPVHFSDEIKLNPKIINRKGQYFTSNKVHQHHHYNPHNKIAISMPPQRLLKRKEEKDYAYYKLDENAVAHACRMGIEKLKEERKRFLTYQQQQQEQQKVCDWVEPSGEKCVYCTLTMQ